MEITHILPDTLPDSTETPFVTVDPGVDLTDPLVENLPTALLYKILIQGHDWYAGPHAGIVWRLPTESGPSVWMQFRPTESNPPPVELVQDPFDWYHTGSVLYQAEYDPAYPHTLTPLGVLATRIRLVRAVPWHTVNIFVGGAHSVYSGRARIIDGTLRAQGDAIVYAEGASTVYATDTSTVHAQGGITLRQGRVDVTKTTIVRASGHCQVFATTGAHVKARGRSKVYLSGNALADGVEDATILSYNGKATGMERAQIYTVHGLIQAQDSCSISVITDAIGQVTDSCKFQGGPFYDNSDVTVVSQASVQSETLNTN